ncbi:MAG: hypothetical protein ACXWP5_16525, partial [Bdellovibrionota bacterium]
RAIAGVQSTQSADQDRFNNFNWAFMTENPSPKNHCRGFGSAVAVSRSTEKRRAANSRRCAMKYGLKLKGKLQNT